MYRYESEHIKDNLYSLDRAMKVRQAQYCDSVVPVADSTVGA